jgi:hypothetical protein
MRRIGVVTLVVGALVAGVSLAPVATTGAVAGVSCSPTIGVVAPAAANGSFHSFGPQRLADTRAQLTNVGAGCTLAVDVPAAIVADATSVVLSVTADRTLAAGFLTVHPCGSARPDVSNVNVRPGAPAANVVIVALDSTRQICVYTSVATDLIVDVTGYLGPNGAAFQEVLTPRRAVDTRFPGQRPDGGSGRVGPGVLTIPRSSLGVPADAAAVIVNLTATQASGSGFLTAYPCAATVPDTSNVNFAADEDRANQAIVGLASDGSLCVFASVATHVIVDVTGVFAGSEGLSFKSSVGTRMVDSRNGVGGPSTPMAAGETRVVDTTGRVLPGTRSVVVNVLATRAKAAGFLTVYPCGSSPSTSSVNFGPGRDVANLVAMSIGLTDAGICVYASAPTDVVIDLFGGFTASGLLRTLTFGPGTPAVTPAFQPDIHDYAARCTAGSNSFAVDAMGMPGTIVTVDDAVLTQHATRTVVKNEDAAVVVIVTGPSGASDSYWIRCLPHDFPPLTVDRPGQPAPGWYLVANAFNPPDPFAEFAMILDEHGTPVWYRRTPPGAIDFKRLPTGQLAWMIPTGGAFGLSASGSYEIRDLDGTLVRNVKTTLGPTDHHDLIRLPNGNFLAITYVQRDLVVADPHTCVDGNIPFTPEVPTAVVDGVIEEINPAGTMVWWWNSRDHVDPSESVVDLCFPGSGGQAHVLDPVHLNSIDVMPDGDIIASARHLDAIFRIDKTTKNVEWKLGGTPATHDVGAKILAFRNDPDGGFARQHDAKVMANGDISVFDNHTSFPFATETGAARATEYAIDATNGTATLVRSQVRADGSFSGAMGSAQWLDDGGVLVGFGALSPAFSEFAADGTAQYSVSFPSGHFTYRAVKEPPASFSINALRATAGH